MEKIVRLLVLVFAVVSILAAIPSLSLADPPPMQTVVTSLMDSTGEDVPIPAGGEWATLSLEIDEAPPEAVVRLINLKFSIGRSWDKLSDVPPNTLGFGKFEVKLVSGKIEYPVKLLEEESENLNLNGIHTWTIENIEGFAGWPVNGAWSLMVRDIGVDPVPPISKDRFYIDGMTLRVYYETEMPMMYQVTDGIPGEPAMRRCEGCGQLVESIMPDSNEKSQEPSPSVPKAPSSWEIVKEENFEGYFPGYCWILYDGSDDGKERTWGDDDYRSHRGYYAAWPAKLGADGIDPQPPVNYPNNLNSWMVCGPFDLSDASNAYAAFWLWSQIEEGYDEFFFGIGYEPDDWFHGYAWNFSVTSWQHETIYFPAYTGSPVHDSMWFAWNFESDYSNPVNYEGPWVDDIEIATSFPCPVVDPGEKGLHIHPNELPGQVQTVKDADVNWIRLEFQMEKDGSIDLEKYATIVDSLCEHGMTVIGLVDYVTIPDDLDGDGIKDYDDDEDYESYQRYFTQTVEGLASYFKGNIRYWEVWNEENGSHWHIRPEYYAALLVKVSRTVKKVDANNQIILGGLDHVHDPNIYLIPVYNYLDLHWDYARPFDILAIHPYFTWEEESGYILDPNVYLFANKESPPTILDPYLREMDNREVDDKDIWITELGWNSALSNPAIENCPGMKAWCVDILDQARHLRDSFDILFQEVEDPGGNTDRVKKIVWYRYLDAASEAVEIAEEMSISLDEVAADPQAVCPDDWGLVDGNREPKPSYQQYKIYPESLPYGVMHLPIVLKDYSGGGATQAPQPPVNPYPPPAEPVAVPTYDPYPPPAP